jgi:signal transduction histidine kinase
MGFVRNGRAAFESANTPRRGMFGFPNVSQFRDMLATQWLVTGRPPANRSLHRFWRKALGPWPLTARVPIVSAGLSLIVAIAVSHVMMTTLEQEQERGVRRLAAVYIDGISTTIYPHVVARNIVNLTEALHRTMWFHQSMREQRALVRLPDGSLYTDVSGTDADRMAPDPYHDLELRRRLEEGNGLVFDADTGTGWASRAIKRNGDYVADLYVALELKPLIEERLALQRKLITATALAGIIAAFAGFLIVRRMEAPIRLLTTRLKTAQAGDLSSVPNDKLPPASSEYGRLLRGYNDLVEAVYEREALSKRLAERERDSVLGRLAATVAHEVRNPLAGMSTALDTARKFGNDPEVRSASLDLIERGLWTIGDVVGSVLAFHRMPTDSRKLAPSDLEDLRLLIEPELRRRQLQLIWQNAVATDLDVNATETRQIALNLLLNACEASPEGAEISFSAWTSRDQGMAPSTLWLEIVDAGPGLPPAIVAALTESDTSEVYDAPRGLGIRVIRDLVRGLNGWIVAAAATIDQGSRITIRLPIQQMSEATT